MNPFRPLLAITALTLTLACAGPSVQYDYDAKTPFSSYQSFAWQIAPSRTGPFDNAIVSGRVKRAVEAELGAKGFRQDADSPNPDFLVTYHPQDENRRPQQARLGLGFGIGPLGVGIRAPIGDPNQPAVAGIVLEILDFRSGTIVWKATAEGALQGSDTPEEADSGVKAAVHSLLQRFPPPGK